MPNNVLEAMAAARPVVATAVGDVPLMIEDGATGRVVSPDDAAALGAALGGLLEDPAAARALGAAARERATRDYTVAAMVDGTEACVRKAVERRKGV
jgi:glycosyltransferase involved in cell wall biosynthesis